MTLLSFDDNRLLQSTLMAERATHAGDHWVLEQVKLTRLESGRTATEEVTLWRWDTAITPQLLTLDVVEPETLPLLELWPYAQYLKQQGMVFTDIELAFWRKLLQPLATLGFVLVFQRSKFGFFNITRIHCLCTTWYFFVHPACSNASELTYMNVF